MMSVSISATPSYTRPSTGGRSNKSFILILVIVCLVASSVSGVIYLQHHSNREHNPNLEGTKARTVITSFMAAMAAYLSGNGQDPRKGCGIIFEGDEAVKVSLFIYDAATNSTYSLWFFVNKVGTPLKGPWGGSFPHDDLERFNRGPKDLKPSQTWISLTDLSQCPTAPNFLQAAQP